MPETRMIDAFREDFAGIATADFANQYPSIYDWMVKGEIPHKKEIIEYLRSGKVDMATTAPAKDVVTGELLPFRDCGFYDDEYSWGATLPYYIERYNVALPDDVTEHILEKAGVC